MIAWAEFSTTGGRALVIYLYYQDAKWDRRSVWVVCQPERGVTAVAWVPGEPVVEAAPVDPRQGVVSNTLDPQPADEPRFAIRAAA